MDLKTGRPKIESRKEIENITKGDAPWGEVWIDTGELVIVGPKSKSEKAEKIREVLRDALMVHKEPYQLTLTLTGLPKTLNAIGRAHWAVKVKEAKRWHNAILGEMLITKSTFPKAPLKKARLVLTRYSSSEPDHDGLVSSFKHVIDGLIKNGIIENDKPSNIGQPEYHWLKAAKKAGKITVEVYEA